MTRRSKKRHEQFIAKQAADRLGRHWVLDDSEVPDFAVADGGMRFGLELCRVFSGPEGRKGAALKADEVHTQRRIDELRKCYESATADTPLWVRFVGCLCNDHLAAVVPALLALDMDERGSENATRVCLFDCGAQLSIYARRSIAEHASWLSVNDRVGWVDRDTEVRVQKAVHDKSRCLAAYRQRTGLEDQRILIYCDATVNSGKLSLAPDVRIDPSGFDVVYFFRYPEAVFVLPTYPN